MMINYEKLDVITYTFFIPFHILVAINIDLLMIIPKLEYLGIAHRFFINMLQIHFKQYVLRIQDNLGFSSNFKEAVVLLNSRYKDQCVSTLNLESAYV